MRIVLALCTTLFAACESNDLGLNALAPARVAVTVPLGDSSLNQALGLDNLHLTLRHASGSAALDSTIPIRAGADSVAVDFSVVLRPTASARPPREPLVFAVWLTNAAGDSLFAAGPDTVQVVGGGTANAVTLVPQYVGVGHDAVGVRINRADTSLFAGMTLVLTATAVNTAGLVIRGTPIIWTSSDTAVATVARVDSGRVVLGATPGTVRVVARLLTGFADTATVQVQANLVFTSVTVGSGHSCGVTTSGAAYCWGNNTSGQLGTGQTVSGSSTPVAVAGGLSFATVDAFHDETCGVTMSGTVYCWGTPPTSLDTSWSPVPLPGGLTFATISLGEWSSCGLTTNGAAYCWGINSGGELGDSLTEYESELPVPVAGGLTFAQISVGLGSACGVTSTGAGYCWGLNGFGQLGVGADTGASSGGGFGCILCIGWPVPVAGGVAFKSITHYGMTACGVTTSGIAYCWGFNGSGSLGTGSTSGPEGCGLADNDLPYPCSTRPAPVTGGLTFATLVEKGLCGVTMAGDVYCWGNGTPTPQRFPTGGPTFAMVDGPTDSTWTSACGIASIGVAYCWGNNTYGQLGDGSHASSLVPVKVVGQR